MKTFYQRLFSVAHIFEYGTKMVFLKFGKFGELLISMPQYDELGTPEPGDWIEITLSTKQRGDKDE